MTTNEIMAGIKGKIVAAKASGRRPKALCMDAGTGERVFGEKMPEMYATADEVYVSMSGQHYLFGLPVFFKQRGGVDLLFDAPRLARFRS